MKISLPHRHGQMVGDCAFSHYWFKSHSDFIMVASLMLSVRLQASVTDYHYHYNHCTVYCTTTTITTITVECILHYYHYHYNHGMSTTLLPFSLQSLYRLHTAHPTTTTITTHLTTQPTPMLWCDGWSVVKVAPLEWVKNSRLEENSVVRKQEFDEGPFNQLNSEARKEKKIGWKSWEHIFFISECLSLWEKFSSTSSPFFSHRHMVGKISAVELGL